MFQYRVEVNGLTVWQGEGDSPFGTIPAEYLDRPADPAPGEAFPPPAHLYETTADGEQLIGVQRSLADERDIEAAARAALEHPDTAAAIVAGEIDPRDVTIAAVDAHLAAREG